LTNINQIQEFGGNFIPPHNFLHEENLDYLLEAVEAEMFGAPLYPEIYHKAGLYMYNIVANHIFQDGNKRTGLQVAMIFLLMNDYQIIANYETLIQFTLSVASGELSLEQVQNWFEIHTQKIES
jgi:death on curing protein